MRHSYYEVCVAKGSQIRAAKRHYTFMLNAALFEQPEYRITHLTMDEEGIKKLRNMHVVSYYLTKKKRENEALAFVVI